jgi:hypothetical protein
VKRVGKRYFTRMMVVNMVFASKGEWSSGIYMYGLDNVNE